MGASIRLTTEQMRFLRQRFEAIGSAAAHAQTWSRRAYAPQLIHGPNMRDVKARIEDDFPHHVIAFDVLFEAPSETAVEFHVDYESLGPFEIPSPWDSIRNDHFLTIHFNLTEDGGCLQTVSHPLWLSWLYYHAIATCGIYNRVHTLLNTLCHLWFFLVATSHPNIVGHGNVFSNVRLHAVSAGAARLSYVVRLVHRDKVAVSRSSVALSMMRSKACRVFETLLTLLPSTDGVCARDVEWDKMA